MSGVYNAVTFQNADSPFTELFFLLKKRIILSNEIQSLVCNSDELKVLRRHTDNAMDILLHGLQDLGNLMSVAVYNQQKSENLEGIGFFISAIGNLTVALNGLRSDAGFLLSQRGEM